MKAAVSTSERRHSPSVLSSVEGTSRVAGELVGKKREDETEGQEEIREKEEAGQKSEGRSACAVRPGDLVLFPLRQTDSPAASEEAGENKPRDRTETEGDGRTTAAGPAQDSSERQGEAAAADVKRENESQDGERETGEHERSSGKAKREGQDGERELGQQEKRGEDRRRAVEASASPSYGLGEVICVYSDEQEETVADLLRCTSAGKPFKSMRAGIITGIPVRALSRLEANEDRIEPAQRSASGEFSPPVLFSLRASPFFTHSVDPEIGALCFFWDLETTGPCNHRCEITQIGCVPRLFRNGYWERVARGSLCDDATKTPGERHVFSAYIRIQRGIRADVKELTGITEELLNEKGIPLEAALLKWSSWVQRIAASVPRGVPIWFVAHSGANFDIPVLLRHEQTLRRAVRRIFPTGCFLKHVGCKYTVDTVVLSRALPWPNARAQSHSLSMLHAQLTGKSREKHQVHNAVGDSIALAEIMEKEPFLSAWQRMKVGRTLNEEFQYQSRLRFLNLNALLSTQT
ncbi:exonuclease [Toxoplasma gondii RUB]|uniref:Exonuclease n=1 Tax=Toxoplasma gondii RUB TaxID=935652 RepID=A0A086LSH9_TOXGO|nr:exonuclease [Toxoplasma gondii RUB]